MAAIVDAAGTHPRRQRRLRRPRRRRRRRAEAGRGHAASSTISPPRAGGQFHFAAEGKAAPPLRIVQVPAGDEPDALSAFLLLDDVPGPRGDDETRACPRLARQPAARPRAGRHATAASSSSTRCSARRRASAATERPAWPGDLVVDEDKAAVSDAVRRFGRGRPMSGDLAVRLKTNPDEPVAMTVAGARGLGNAAVLLSPQGQ